MVDYFGLYGLPDSWDIDKKSLRSRYARDALAAHPDRYARPEFKARAEQVGGLLNRAYDVLRDDGARTRYMASARHVEPSQVSSAFLLQQLEMREKLFRRDEAGEVDPASLDAVESYYRTQLGEVYRNFASYYERDDRDGMADALARLNFFLSAMQDVKKMRLSEDASEPQGNDV